MNDGQSAHHESDYVLLSSVTHPGGREKAFRDAFKALVRGMIEVNDNPTFAYAVDKTDRIVTAESSDLLSEEALDEWDAACEESEAMSPETQKAWIGKVLSSYPAMAELPDLDSYNHLN